MTEQKSKKESLLRCPFCGAEAVLLGHCVFENAWMVECQNKECKCKTEFASKEEAIKTWNTRKPIEVTLERLEKKEEEYLKEYRIRGNEELYGASWGLGEAINIVTEEVG